MKRLIVLFIALSSLIGVTKMEAQVSVGITVGIAPPAIPVYVQPPCPVAGYLWVPGYWAWDSDGYYWVPGVWIEPPAIGLLWTPGYWGFIGGHYCWYGGYWGPHIGFYGGVNYGFGYYGTGFVGGRWDGGVFRYNTAVVRVNNTVIRNTYVDRTVVVHNESRASFNGPGGASARPTAAEESAMHESHTQATRAQMAHVHTASVTRSQRLSANGGNPHTTARSSVGGARYNAAGSSMHTASRATASHPQMQHSAQPARAASRPQPARMNTRPQPARMNNSGRMGGGQPARMGGGGHMGGGQPARMGGGGGGHMGERH